MSDPCKPEACAIQDCLGRNGYDDAKCQDYIDKLYLCCKKYYKESGEESTTCCPKVSLLKLKLEQRGMKK